MRRPSLVLLLLLLGSVPEPAARGEVPPLQPPGKGSGADLGSIGTPRIHPFDPHRFEMAGESWFPLGFYGGSMAMTSNDGAFVNPTSNSRAENAFNYFLATLGGAGLNYYRAWINWGASKPQSAKKPTDWDYHMVHPYLRSDQCCAADGGNRFDLNQLNPDYFSMIQRLVASSRQKGLVAQLALFDCWHVANNRGLTNPNGAPRTNIEHDYYSYYFNSSGQRVANNVNGAEATDGYDWTRGGTAEETPGEPQHVTYQRRFVDQVLTALPRAQYPNSVGEACNENRRNPAFDTFIYSVIRRRDPLRLVMPIDLPEHREVAGHHTPDSSSNAQSIEDMHDELIEQFAWNEPLITDNDCCFEPDGVDAAFRRKKAWAALTAGAHTDYFVNNMPAHEHLMTDPDILASMAQYRHILDFLGTIRPNLLGAVPSDAKVSGANWAFGRPGEEYTAYLPNGGPVTVSDLPATFRATWIDPRTGQWTQEPVGNGPVATLTPPGAGDWGLHIRCGRGSYQAAFTDPFVVPRRIEAEDFDCGGEGFGYHDQDLGNNNNPAGGSTYRFSDVDLQATNDAGGGFHVGWLGVGEWLEYSIQASATGTYQPQLRVAGPGSNGRIRFRLELDGQPQGGVIDTAATGSFTTWRTVTGPELPLGYGTHSLRLVAVSGNANLNWLDFGTAKTLPVGATIAERFTNFSPSREVGDPLNGVAVQIGGRNWTAHPGFGFAPGALTNLNTNGSHVAGLPFGPGDFTQRRASVEALVDPGQGDWVGIGFSKSATGGYWSHGQVWTLLRSNGLLGVGANGTAHTLYSGFPTAYDPDGPNRLKVEYDRVSNSVRLWLNGVPIQLANNDLDSLSFTPDITHVGIHAFKQGGFGAPYQVFIDDFQVEQSGTVPPQTLSLACNADAYVDELHPAANYGSSTLLSTRYEINGSGRHFLLRFQVPSLAGTLVSAKVRIRTRGNPVADASFFRMDNMTWSESGVTWANHMLPPTSWTYVRSGQNLAPHSFHEIDVTEAVSGAGSLTLGVSSDQDLAGQDFYSRESAYPPTLILEYLP